MDIESLRAELQNQIDIVKSKWESICKKEYDGDMEKLYNERAVDIIKDIKPIWELSVQVNGMEVREKLLNVKDIK